jgi:DNA helicase-2/ATP-dependent DNA helicase PcrA
MPLRSPPCLAAAPLRRATHPRGTVQGVVTNAASKEWTRLERNLLAGCDAQQIEAITTPATPLCVLAGAGSGKTRVLTRRIAWRVMNGSATASHVLALTFTRKAAGELRGRLAALGLPETVTAGTFHALALAELKRFAAEHRRRPPVVLGSKSRMLAEALGDDPAGSASWKSSRRQGGGGRRGRETARSFGDLASEIEWAKSRCLRPCDFVRAAVVAERRSSWEPAEVAELWERYELLKHRRGVLDFEDLLARCTEHLELDHEFAASAHWRFRHVFVDEYQDVNEAQQRLLRAWLGANDDLCVVGDPHQAIYSWNGSNPRAITEFCDDFASATMHRLAVNYRSTHEVLSVAGAVLGGTTVATAGGPCPEGPLPTIASYDDELAEAAGVAEGARRARRPGRSWSQIAVLARTNAQLRVLETAFAALCIPCRTPRASDLLAKAWVQTAVRQASQAADAPALRAWASDLLAALAPRDVESSEETVDEEPAEGLDPGACADLAQLARLADEYVTEDVVATGAGFENWLSATLKRDSDSRGRDEVELTTFHRAKGLEWAVVFVTGLEDGYVPIAHAREPEALAEERRLLYVACTRAEEELHCSWAEERTFSSGPVLRSPSPWLRAIEAAHQDLERSRRSSPRTAQEALAASRWALEHGAGSPTETS